MKKYFSILFYFTCSIFPAVINAQIEERPNKSETIDIKYSNGQGQYVLACTTYYDDEMNPSNYEFALAAQNDRFSSIRDLFIICYGSAEEVYECISMILDFSEIQGIRGKHPKR